MNTDQIAVAVKKLLLVSFVWICWQQNSSGQNEIAVAASKPSLTVEEQRLYETRVRTVINNVLPTVVAVESPLGGITRETEQKHNHFINCGTGVIISREGLVLSQWHVSHRRAGGDSQKPGTRLSLVLHDGRKVNAKLMGASKKLDLSVIQITTPGPYPFLAFADMKTVALGDRVLRIGHPFGYRADRGCVARLGTVLYRGSHVDLVTDCQVDGGDSGGPLIDMHGRLLGIAHATTGPFVAHWIMPGRSGPPFNHHDTDTITRVLSSMQSSSKQPTEMLDMDDTQAHRDRFNQTMDECLHPAVQSILNPRDWTQGEYNLSQWRPQSNLYSNKLVQFYRNKIPCAIGTCVANGGWVVSKASELGPVPQFRNNAGDFVNAKISKVDLESDLALLRVDVDLQPVEWQLTAQPVGTFVSAPDPHGQPIVAGIVSVAARGISNRKKLGPVIAPARTSVSGVLDVCPYFDKPGVMVKYARNDAAEKGLRNGDVIVKINDMEVTKLDDFNNYVANLRGNDEVVLTVRRNECETIYKVRLTEVPYVDCPGAVSPYANMRCDDFAEVFEHDMPLALNECGGPVIALDGRALGITIARVGDHGCMALPATAITARLKEWKLDISDPPSRGSP